MLIIARLLAILLLTVPLSAESPCKLTIEGGYFRFEPAWVRLRVTVEPDDENRGLTVSAESEAFSTSSYEQLEGDRARRTRWITWKDLPAGEYDVRATVSRGYAETWSATGTFTVLSSR